MKKLILLLSIALLSQSTFAQSKVGTIDADYILTQLPEMQQVNEGLKAYNEELQQTLDSTITQYEGRIKDYEANKVNYTAEEKKAQENQIISLENEIKGFRQKASVMMQMKRNELTQPLYKKINAAMLQVIQEEGYSHILHAGGNALAFYAEDSDITGKVLEKLGIATEK